MNRRLFLTGTAAGAVAAGTIQASKASSVKDQINALLDGLVAAGKNLEDYCLVLTPEQETEVLSHSAGGWLKRAGTIRGVATYMSTEVTDMVVVPNGSLLAFFDGLHGAGVTNPAFLLHRELSRLGVTLKRPVQQHIPDLGCEYACADTLIFDINQAARELARKLTEQGTDSFSFRSGRFERWSDSDKDRGITYRYRDVVVNMFEFQASNGHQPRVTVLRCGVRR